MPTQGKFNSKYNIPKLIQVLPELEDKIISNKKGEPTINFSDSESIYLLNKALLKSHYQIKDWTLPKNYLVPPVPGRFDYVNGIVNLILSEGSGSYKPSLLNGIDIGCGASCIYPLLFTSEYKGRMLATDVDLEAIKNAKKIAIANPDLRIEFYHQKIKNSILNGVIRQKELYEFTMCNPPFYENIKSAQKANERKEKNLKTGRKSRNFLGQQNELIYPGGEKSFVRKIIEESFSYHSSVLWFSVLVSDKNHLKLFKNLLKDEKVKDFKIVEMTRGNKISRFIAWTFFNRKQRVYWLNHRLR